MRPFDILLSFGYASFVRKLTGIPASSGIAIGKAFLYLEDDFPEIPRYAIGKTQIEAEWGRLIEAIAEADREIRALHERASRDMTKEQADIFEAHLLMLEDPEFQGQIKKELKSTLLNIEWVVWDISRRQVQKLAASADAYLRERAADIADVSRRVMNKLLSITRFSLADLSEDVILVAHDLLPSDVLAMNKNRVKGIAMDMGSRTSHTAILARAFAIPAVLGLSSISSEINDGEMLVVNGDSGRITLGPDKKSLQQYEKAIAQYRKTYDKLLAMRELPAETLDGYPVSLKANIEIPEEAEQVMRYGAEGIGLYRSEFLFLTSGQSAEEEEQYQAYSRVIRAMKGLPVTIRTVDVGGDKILPDLQDTNEKNPLLGWRAVRFCLALPELFKTQFRAILRASVEGPVKIMFPMISGVEELEQSLVLLEEAKAECRDRGQAYSEDIETGTMIEIPSAAMTADILAARSRFFSIGTNDLIQYTLAADRGNEKVGYLAQPFHPAMIRLLKQIIDAAHKGGIKAAMCGELAGDPSATALLLGMGLDEFSMTASSIPVVKQIIRGATLESCRALAEAALGCISFKQISDLAASWMAEYFPSR
jgi:phosphotransferase system enzyme I (PtsI)